MGEDQKNTQAPENDQAPKRKILDGKTKKSLLVVGFGVVLFVVLNNITGIGGAISFVLTVLSPFIVGVVIAFFLNLPMRFLERRLFYCFRHARVWSILVTYILAFAAIIILLALVIPQLFSSTMTLYDNIPGYLANLDELAGLLVRDFGVAQNTIDSIYAAVSEFFASSGVWLQEQLPAQLMNVLASIGSGFFTGFTSLIASVYMLANKEKLRAQCKRVLYAFLPQKATGKTIRVARLSNEVFAGFLGGRLLESLVVGIVCFIFMAIVNAIHSVTGIGWLQMPYALLISTLIGITNIIPYFGPFLGTIPALVILVMVSPLSALLFLAFIIVLQQVDNNLLAPRLIGHRTGLPALWVFAGTILGGKLAGITGMLLGVPVMAVLYVLGSELVENRLKKRGLDKTITCAPSNKAQKNQKSK